MSNEINGEIKELATRLSKGRHPSVLKAACLIQLTIAMFSRFLSLEESANMLRIQRQHADSSLREQGLDPLRLDSALAGLEQARDTANYLGSLPA